MPELFEDSLNSTMIPTKAASEFSGYNADYLARLCREGKIEGTQVGRTWLINRASLEAFVEEQGKKKQERAEELRAARGREYRRAQRPVMRAAFGSAAGSVRAAAGSARKAVVDTVVARTRRRAAALPQIPANAPAYSHRLAALAGALAVVAGAAYLSTSPTVRVAFSAAPDAARSLAAATSPLRLIAYSPLRASDAFSSEDARARNDVRAAVPASMRPLALSLPRAHEAARAYASFAAREVSGSIASLHALTDTSRAPFRKTDAGAALSAAADARLALLSRVAHDPLGSAIAGYVYTGAYALYVGEAAGDAYLQAVHRAGSDALALAAGTRDTAARGQRASVALLDGYARGVYAWNDAAPKVAGTAVLALYDAGTAMNGATAETPALARAGKDRLAYGIVDASQAVSGAVMGAEATALAPFLPEAPVSVPALASAPRSGGPLFADSAPARLARAAQERIAQAGGAVLLLPLRAEDTMLGAAGYAASLIDGTEGPALAASERAADVSHAQAASAVAFLPDSWGAAVGRFFHATHELARTLISSGFHTLASLMPGGAVMTPALTVVHTAPGEPALHVLPVPAPGLTNAGGSAVGAGSKDTIVQNIVNNYYPQTVFGGSIDDAMLALVQPYVRQSIDSALRNVDRNTRDLVSEDGGTLSDVTIESGTADLSDLAAENAAIGTLSAGTTTLGLLTASSTSIDGSLDVSGALSADSLLVANIQSQGPVIAPSFTATDTAATSSFTNLTATDGFFTKLAAGALSIISGGKLGIGTSAPAVSLDIAGTDAVRLPVGTTAERPAGGTGYVRYNTTTHQFEGYSDSGVWQGLGGVIDADQDTYVTADTNNANENTLRFVTAGSERLTILPDGNVGIGITTPSAMLTVGGTLSVTGTTTIGSLDGLVYGMNGALSAATVASPLSFTNGALSLSTAGDWTGTLDGFEGSYYLANSFSTTSADSWLSGKSTTNLVEGTNLYFTDIRARTALSAGTGLAYDPSSGTFSAGVIPVENGGTGATAQTAGGIAYYDGTRITTGTGLAYAGGNVGIGTSSPSAKLTVAGDTALGGDASIAGNVAIGGTATIGALDGLLYGASGVLGTVAVSTPLSFAGGVLSISTSTFSGSGSGLDADLIDGLDSSYLLANSFSTSSADGWLGTKDTDDLLEGAGNLYFTDARARSALSATSPLVYSTTTGAFSLGTVPIANGGTNATAQTAGGIAYFDGTSLTTGTGLTYSGGSVGIGTSNPTGRLTVEQNTPGGTVNIDLKNLASSATGNEVRVNLMNYVSLTNLTGSYISSITTNGATGEGDLAFGVWGGGINGQSEVLRLTGSGNVGIGTTSPSAKLTVEGDARVSGAVAAASLTTTGAADVASLSVGALSGFLKATAGAVSVALVDLSTDVTGSLGSSKGGTGFGSYDAGDILYADITGDLVKLPAGSAGEVLKIQGGLPAWGADQTVGEGGSDGIFATSSGRIYPLDTSVVTVLGSSATSTGNSILEVDGQQYISTRLAIATTSPSAALSVGGSGLFSGNVTAGGTLYAASLTLGGSAFTSLLGTGLVNDGGTLAISTTTLGLASASTTAALTSSLTSNYVPKWSNSGHRFLDSLIYDSGTQIGIGTATNLTGALTANGTFGVQAEGDIFRQYDSGDAAWYPVIARYNTGNGTFPGSTYIFGAGPNANVGIEKPGGGNVTSFHVHADSSSFSDAVTVGTTLSVTGTATLGNVIDSGLTADTLAYADAGKQLSSATIASPLSFSGGTLSLSTAGDWTGTLDGQEGSWYLDRANHTGTQAASTISDFSTAARSALSATSPLLYSTTTGAFSLGTVPVGNGGTGVSTLASGQVLLGNGTSAVTSVGRGNITGGLAIGVTGGTGAVLGSGVTLTLNTAGDWTGTFDGQEGSWYVANSFSTTSANTWLAGKSTTNLDEGTNLYYTDARARTALSATSPIVYDSGTGIFSLGTVPIANGGTNATSQTTGGIAYYDGTSLTTGTSLTYSGGKVGIGTAAPDAGLEVLAPNGDPQLRLTNATFTTKFTDFEQQTSGLMITPGGGSQGLTVDTSTSGGDINFLLASTGGNPQLSIKAGSLGGTTFFQAYGGSQRKISIGDDVDTSDPATLQVTGDSSFTGSLSGTRFLATDSVTAPGFSWTGDDETGIYHVAAGTIGFSTGGIGRAVIDANGYLGIGTTTPAYALDVYGSGSIEGTALHVGTYSSASTYAGFSTDRAFFGYDSATSNAAVQGISGKGIEFNVNSNTFGSGTAMVITSAGNVGIGTSAPNTQLHVETANGGTNTVLNALTLGRSTSGTAAAGIGTGITFQAERADGSEVPAAAIQAILTGVGTGTSQNGALAFLTVPNSSGAVEAMRIAANGNVGIGTNAPTQLLHIKSTVNALAATSGTTQTGILRLNGSGMGVLDFGQAGATGAWLQSTNSGDLSTNYNLLLNPNGGNVGIGTTNPSYKLDVFGNGGTTAVDSSTVTDVAGLRDSSGNGVALSTYTNGDTILRTTTTGSALVFGTRTGSANYERMRILANGNVGIGTTTPDSLLNVVGNQPVALFKTSVSSVTTASVRLRLAESSGTSANTDNYWDVGPGITGSGDFDFGIGLNGGTALSILRSNGNVGIGTTTPGATLAVAGNTYLGGNLTATGTTYLGSDITITPGASADFLNTYLFANGITSYAGITSSGVVSAPQFLATDSATAPGHSWSGDEETGMYHAAANTIGFATGGIGRAVIDANGYLGVGTSNPAAALDVIGGGGASNPTARFSGYENSSPLYTILELDSGVTSGYLQGALSFSRSGTTTAAIGYQSPDTSSGRLTFSTMKSGTLTERLRIDENGNVGIGTTNPAAKLSFGAGVQTNQLYLYDNGTANKFGLGTAAGVLQIYSGSNTNLGYRTAFGTYDGTTFTEKVSILNNGTVGIGTSTPSAKLEIADTAPNLRISSTLNSSSWTNGDVVGALEFFSADTSGPGGEIGGAGVKSAIRSVSNNSTFGGYTDLTFSTAGADGNDKERMRIDRDGNVGIGTSTPGATLDVFGNSGSDTPGQNLLLSLDRNNPQHKFAFRYSADGSALNFDRYSGGVWSASMTWDRLSGNVGIGTTTPSNLLTVSGANIPLYLASSGANSVILFSNSTLTGTNTYLGYLADDFVIRNNGGERFRITSAGNVGIGTTAPTDPLTIGIAGGAGVDQSIRINSAGATYGKLDTNGTIGLLNITATNGTSAGAIAFKVGGSATEAMRIDKNGDIGVRTANPETSLHIYGSGTSTTLGQLDTNLRLQSQTSTAGDGSEISFRGHSAATESTGTYAAISAPLVGNSGTGSVGYLAFSTKAATTDTALTERMRIDQDGYVGIGTASPQAKLDTNGTIRAIGINTPASGAGTEISYNGGTGYVFAYDRSASQFKDLILGQTTGQLVIKGTGGGGRIGIGTTNPTQLLDIEGTSGGRAAFTDTGTKRFSIGNSGTGAFSIRDESGSADRVVIDLNGNVGIGTTNPSDKLTVEVGTNNRIGFQEVASSALADFTTGGTAMQFSRPQDGTNNLSAIFAYNNANLALATRDDLVFAAGGASNYTAAPERLRITGTGNVGIGTANPGRRIDVYAPSGSANVAGFRTSDYANNTAGSALLFDFGASSGNTYSALNAVSAGGNASNNLVLQNVGGNVGIGTATPGYALSVVNGGNNYQASFARDAAKPLLIGSDSSGFARINANGGMGLSVGGDEYMRLANGNVGIGTSTPYNDLDVNGDINAYYGISGGYTPTGGSGAFGATIWSLGQNWHGTAAGNSYSPTGVYGISWLRNSNSNRNANIGEGLYAYAAATLYGGIGTAGIYSANNIIADGQFLAKSSDSAALPSYTWAGDNDTGMWHTSTNSIGFTAAGTTRVTINSSGLTATDLSVSGTATFANGIKIGSGNGNGIAFWGGAPTTYGTFMSNDAAYKYGDVTDYYIANVVSTGTGRGFVWSYGTTPSMALNASSGDLTIKGDLTSSGTGNSSFMGKVGIGTSTPSADRKLTVQYDQNYQLQLANSGTNGGTWNIGQSNDSWGSGGGSLVFVPDGNLSNGAVLTLKNSGNVGIGTVTPSAKLAVAGSGNFTGSLEVGGTGSGNQFGTYVPVAQSTTDLAPDMTSASAPSPVSASPSSYWQVFDDNSGTAFNYPTGNALVFDFGSGNTQAVNGYTLTSPTESAAPKDWTFAGSANCSTYTVLDTRSGETGGYPSKETYTFSNSTAYRCYRLIVTAVQSGSSSLISEQELLYTNTDSGSALVVKDTGNVGIGTSAPSAQFTTTGTMRFAGFGGGVLTTDSLGNVTVSSDERLKDITGSYDRGLAELELLSPILYHWNATSGLAQADLNAGFSAQNVQAVIPEAVGMDSRGYLTLQDRPILAASVNAIKELASTTGQLSLATTSLKTQFDSFASQYAAMQASSTMPHALTATQVNAGSMTIAEGVSAGTMTAQSVTAEGTVSAARYVVPSAATAFSVGSSTISAEIPDEALTSGAGGDVGVDLYALASYGVASVQALAARTDLLATRIDDVETRISALEALNAGAGATAEGAVGLTVSTLKSALQSLGIVLKQGYLALDSLVTHQITLVKGEDGTSSAGSDVIPAGATEQTVHNPLVHPTSKVFLTFTSSIQGAWYLSEKTEGSFTIVLDQPQSADAEFDYFLLQTEGAQVAAAGDAFGDTGDDAGQQLPPPGSTEAPSAPDAVSEEGGPSVTLNGSAAVQIPQGGSWTDPGATAVAADGTDLTAAIAKSGSVDTQTSGLYTLVYSVTDANGKHGERSRVVSVLAPVSGGSGAGDDSGSDSGSATDGATSGDAGTAGSGATDTGSSTSGGASAGGTGAPDTGSTGAGSTGGADAGSGTGTGDAGTSGSSGEGSGNGSDTGGSAPQVTTTAGSAGGSSTGDGAAAGGAS